MSNYLDFFIFAVVISLLIIVGVYKVRYIQSESAYLFAERKTSWLALTMTLVMTELNSATLLSFSSLGYLAGFWALLLPCIFLVGLLFYALTVAKKWKQFNGISVAEFFRVKYGNKIGTFASSLLLIAMVGFSAAYVKSLSLIFQPLFPFFNPWVVSAALLGIILIMSLKGGLVSIIRIDIASFIFTLLFSPLMIYFVWRLPPNDSLSISLAQGQDILPLRFIISLIILTIFTYILAPWYSQKIFAAKSARVAFWGVISAAILVFLFYGAAIFATALLRQKGIACRSGEQALPLLIARFFPIGFKGLAYAFLFTTSATTLTGVWSAMSSIVVGDFSKLKASSSLRVLGTTICFAILSYLLANTLIDRVFDKLILANIPIASLSFGLLAGFYWKRVSCLGVYLSIIVGCLGGTGAYLLFGEAGGYTWYWAVYAIPLSFLTGIVVSYLGTKFKAAESIQ